MTIAPRIRATLNVLRQAWCGVSGHDRLLHYTDDSLALRCVSCGHETPGWSLTERPPTVTVKGDPKRHSLNRHRLVATRRIA